MSKYYSTQGRGPFNTFEEAVEASNNQPPAKPAAVQRLIIANAFSLSMLDREQQSRAPGHYLGGARYPTPVADPEEYVLGFYALDLPIESAVGHADTARLFSQILGHTVEVNRTTIKLDENTVVLIGQYIGPRLPEGATELPEGAKIEWWAI